MPGRQAWIGYETAEEAAVRHAPAMWITSPDAKALAAEKRNNAAACVSRDGHAGQAGEPATLYATGQDTVSAWVNGAQVLTADPLPPYKQMPWKKFVTGGCDEQAGAGRQRHRD